MGEDRLTPRSSRVKAARRLTRRTARLSERRFLAEGPQAIREALAQPGRVVEVFSTVEGRQRQADLVAAAAAADVAWTLVDEAALASLTETVAPQGVVAVCEFVDVPLAEVLQGPAGTGARLVAVTAHVRDPGNAGAVVRCADAAGADGVVLAGTSVDPYNGKTVRATVGSLFHLPIAFGPTVEEAVLATKEAGMLVLAADGTGDLSLDEAADAGLLRRRTAWLFGNEAWGLPEAERAASDHVVRVPIYGRAESLNLATAAAVCLYASAREQRRDVGAAPTDAY